MARLGFVRQKGERTTAHRGQSAKARESTQRESMDFSRPRHGTEQPFFEARRFEQNWCHGSFEPDWSLAAGFEVSQPGDKLEREADRMAEEVVGLPAQGRLRKSAGLHSKQGEKGSGGEALPAPLRESMETRFGEDFSGVRLHRDSEAHAMASAVEARAFTVGRDLYFREGAFRPETRDGQQLIAHELTHTLQQPPAASPQARVVQRQGVEGETSKPSPKPQRPAKRFEPGQLVVAKISFALMDRLGGEPGQKKVKQIGRSELLKVEGEVPGSGGHAYHVVPMKTPTQEEVSADGKRRLGVASLSWIEDAPAPTPAVGADGQTPTQVGASTLTKTTDAERPDGARAETAAPSPATAPAPASIAPPGPNDVLHHIVTLQKPGDVGGWWAAGPKQNPEQWSGALSDWERRYIATFTGAVPAPLRMRVAVNPDAPTAEEAAAAVRLFGKGVEAPSGDARAAILTKYANFENRRRIVAHYTLTHPATVRLQLGLFRFVRDINPIHFAFERGFQIGGGKEMFTDKDVSRVGAAAEFFLALAIAFGTAKVLQATKPPTGPTTPMPEVVQKGIGSMLERPQGPGVAYGKEAAARLAAEGKTGRGILKPLTKELNASSLAPADRATAMQVACNQQGKTFGAGPVVRMPNGDYVVTSREAFAKAPVIVVKPNGGVFRGMADLRLINNNMAYEVTNVKVIP
jgi:hypothetical protein